MCLGALDLKKVRKIRSILDGCTDDLIINHRDILCKDPARDFTRNRDFTPRKIINTLLRYESKSSESELIDILDCEGTARNINAAFLSQRRKLGGECFPWLFRNFTEAIMSDGSLGFQESLFRGRHILACDGSDVNIAFNPNDPLTHVEKKGKKGYNQIHLNGLFDICTGAWMAASIQGIHKKQERRALVEMIDGLKYAGKSVITADRGYESFNVFAACIEAGASFVIRLKDIESNGIISAYDLKDDEFDTFIRTKLTKRRTKEALSNPDEYTVLPFYTDFDFFGENGEAYEISVRIVRFRLPNGSYVAVATNLGKDEFDIRAIAELYRLRWGCETAFRKLKYTIGLVNFHSWKMEYLKQELFARLIAFNFCAFIVHALQPENVTPNANDKDGDANAPDRDAQKQCRLGIAFSQAVTVCRKLLTSRPISFIRNAIATIKAHVFAIRPDRSYPRKVKPKSCIPFGYKPG